jgi:hypothetical protein
MKDKKSKKILKYFICFVCSDYKSHSTMGPSDSDREREEGATHRKIHRYYLKGLSHEKFL